MMQQATPITQEILNRAGDIAREMLEGRFALDGLVFDPIIVERKIDHYGDEYIDIRIVFDGKVKQLDVSWTVGMVGWIHSKLEGEGIYLTNTIGKRFTEKVEWDYVQKHGWDYVEEHGWPKEDESVNPQDLLRIAEGLASGALGGGRGRPRQAELRRAISAAYYAMFHTLALCGANMLVGATHANRSQPDWNQVYRALEHGYARNQCNNRAAMSRFSSGIRRFGQLFVLMQRERQAADYDPSASFSRAETIEFVDEATRVIAEFEDADTIERRAFAVFVLFRLRSG